MEGILMKTPTVGTALASLRRTHLRQDLKYFGEPGYIYRLTERLSINSLEDRLEMPVEMLSNFVINTPNPFPSIIFVLYVWKSFR